MWRRRSARASGDSELIEGVVIDKAIVHTNMPRKIENAKIALFSAANRIKGY